MIPQVRPSGRVNKEVHTNVYGSIRLLSNRHYTIYLRGDAARVIFVHLAVIIIVPAIIKSINSNVDCRTLEMLKHNIL